MAPTRHRTAGLPSWVPDWSDPGSNDGDAASPIQNESTHAATTSEFIIMISDDNQRLMMLEKIVDQIVFCGENLSVNVPQVMKAFGDTSGSGLKVDDRMRDIYQAFKTLKAWAETSQGVSTYATSEQCSLDIEVLKLCERGD